MNDSRSRTLITVDELVGLLDAGHPVVLLDVVDEQGAAPEDRPKIPDALSVHLATDFSGKPTPGSGKRPLPDIHELESMLEEIQFEEEPTRLIEEAPMLVRQVLEGFAEDGCDYWIKLDGVVSDCCQAEEMWGGGGPDYYHVDGSSVAFKVKTELRRTIEWINDRARTSG